MDKARRIGDLLKVNWKEISIKEFAKGLEEEADEHKDIVKGDLEIAGKIALAHLRKYPEYYSELAELEKDMEEERGSELPLNSKDKGKEEE
jgi:phosphopentomutase